MMHEERTGAHVVPMVVRGASTVIVLIALVIGVMAGVGMTWFALSGRAAPTAPDTMDVKKSVEAQRSAEALKPAEIQRPVETSVDSLAEKHRIARVEQERQQRERAVQKQQEAAVRREQSEQLQREAAARYETERRNREEAAKRTATEERERLSYYKDQVLLELPSPVVAGVLAGDGEHLAVWLREGRLQIVDMKDRSLGVSTEIGQDATALLGGGKHLVVLKEGGRTIQVRDVATGDLVATHQLPWVVEPAAIAVPARAGGPALVIGRTKDGVALHEVELVSGTTKSLVAVPEKSKLVKASPDGRFVIASTTRSGVLFDRLLGTTRTFSSLGSGDLYLDAQGRVFSGDTLLLTEAWPRGQGTVPHGCPDLDNLTVLSGDSDVVTVRHLATGTKLMTLGRQPPGHHSYTRVEGPTIWADLQRGRCAVLARDARTIALRHFSWEEETRSLSDLPLIARLPEQVLKQGGRLVLPLTMLGAERISLIEGPPGLVFGADGIVTWEVPTGRQICGRQQARFVAERGDQRQEFELYITVAAPDLAQTTAVVRNKPYGLVCDRIFPRGQTSPMLSVVADPETQGLFVCDGKRLIRFDADGFVPGPIVPLEQPFTTFAVGGGMLVGIDDSSVQIYDGKTLGIRHRILRSSARRVTGLVIDARGKEAFLAFQRLDSELAGDPLVRVDLVRGIMTAIPDTFGDRIALHQDGYLYVYRSFFLVKQAEVVAQFGQYKQNVLSGTVRRFLSLYAIQPTRLVRQVTNSVGGVGDGSGLHVLPGGTAVRLEDEVWVEAGDLKPRAKPAVTGRILGFTNDGGLGFQFHDRSLIPVDMRSFKALPPIELYGEWHTCTSAGVLPNGTGIWVVSSDPSSGAKLTVAPDALRRDDLVAVKPPTVISLPDPSKAIESKVPLPFEVISAPVAVPKPTPADLGLAGRKHTGEQSAKEIAKRSSDAVVQVAGSSGVGSGFIIGAGGWILTCAHVVDDDKRVQVTHQLQDGRLRLFEAQVVACDSKEDLALLKIVPPSPLSPVILSLDRSPAMGEGVVVIGNPSVGDSILEKTLTKGVVSNPAREIENRSYVQVDAAINPGNSGGPIFDESGNVFGVVVLKARIEAAGFAVAPARLKAFLERQAKP